MFHLRLREVAGHLGAELQFMVPIELIQRDLGWEPKLDLPEG